jgi:hypothetical protein
MVVAMQHGLPSHTQTVGDSNGDMNSDSDSDSNSDMKSVANLATNIAGIPRPSSPLAQESLDIAESLGVADALLAPDDSRKAWPCSCGNEVGFDVDSCPECGRAFLEELRGLEARERTGPPWLVAYLEASRAMRLSIAGMIALLVAVGIPSLLILFG